MMVLLCVCEINWFHKAKPFHCFQFEENIQWQKINLIESPADSSQLHKRFNFTEAKWKSRKWKELQTSFLFDFSLIDKSNGSMGSANEENRKFNQSEVLVNVDCAIDWNEYGLVWIDRPTDRLQMSCIIDWFVHFSFFFSIFFFQVLLEIVVQQVELNGEKMQ